MILALFVVGYIIIAGGSMAYFERHFEETMAESPVPFFSGLLWPIAVPIILPYVFVKRLFKSHDERAAVCAKEAEELKRRVEELEREMERSVP